MLKITAEEIHFIIYQYLHESGKLKRHSPSTIIGWLIRNFNLIDKARAFFTFHSNYSPLFRLWPLVIRIRSRGQYARKQVQRLPHPQWNAHRLSRKSPHSNSHGDPFRRRKYLFRPILGLLPNYELFPTHYAFCCAKKYDCELIEDKNSHSKGSLFKIRFYFFWSNQ